MNLETLIDFIDQVQNRQSEKDFNIYKIGKIKQPHIKMYIDDFENINIFFSPLLFNKDVDSKLSFIEKCVNDLISDYPNAVAYLDIANNNNTQGCTPHEDFFNCSSSKFNYLENLRGYPRYCWINNRQKELLNLTKLIDINVLYNKNGVHLSVNSNNEYKQMKEIFKPLLIKSECTIYSNMILSHDTVRLFSVIDRSEWSVVDEFSSDDNKIERYIKREYK